MDLVLDEASMAKNVESQADQYFNVYAELSKTLRTWLVAYGIGAPIVLLTNAGFSAVIRKAGDSKYIAGAFLVGVAAQVALAAINKVSMWALYYGETQPAYKMTRRFKFAHLVSETFAIDLLLDLGTIIGFAWATWAAFRIAA